MKRLFSLMLVILLVLSFTGCTVEDEKESDDKDEATVFASISIDGEVFPLTLSDSRTAYEFSKLLPLTINMGELNGNEKFYFLDNSLPTNAQAVGRINAGDLMLYGNNCLVLFYESFSTSYSYTRIGSVSNALGLASALGSGNKVVAFEIRGIENDNSTSK